LRNDEIRMRYRALLMSGSASIASSTALQEDLPMTAPARRDPQLPIDPLFTRRWSPRAFTGEAIDEPTLLSFVEAARWAPSGYNVQPWRFVYARRDTEAWGPIFETLIEFNRGWVQRASALVVVLSKTRWVPPGKTEPQAIGSHSFDAGAAWASLAFQATLSGWHAHAMGGFDRDRLRAVLGVPEDHALEAVVAIGRLGDRSALPESLRGREQPSDRLPLSAIAAHGRFAFDH
jgi:nitroreductase